MADPTASMTAERAAAYLAGVALRGKARALSFQQFEDALVQLGLDSMWSKRPVGFGGRGYSRISCRRRLATLVFERGAPPTVMLGANQFVLPDVLTEPLEGWKQRAITLGADPAFFTDLLAAVKAVPHWRERQRAAQPERTAT